MRLLYLVFFLSGVPALVYQVVWQRSLFTILGVNVESVALVVTAFMLGLGIGSLVGGEVSKRPNIPPLLAFAVIELGIGLFGSVSLLLFGQAGHLTLGTSGLVTFLVAFSLVLFPTLLMGATLPLLVTHLVKQLGNVGRSVGQLYFVNTLGSGVASMLCAVWLLGALGMQGAVYLAVGMNIIVGGGALLVYFRGRRAPAPAVVAESSGSGAAGQPGMWLSTPMSLLLVAFCGFISLSYEILWVRVYGFLSGGTASTFPMVLSAFLVGLAAGSLLSTRYCEAADARHESPLRSLAVFLYLANVIGFLVVPLTAMAASHSWLARYVVPLGGVAVAAAMLGATLPLISHASVRPNARAGAGLSYLYVANIIGSAAGSLLTGFVLMNHMGLQALAVLLAVLGLGLSAALAISTRQKAVRVLLPVGLTAAAIVLAAGKLFDATYERLQYKELWTGQRYTQLHENRSGVISVDSADTIYGDGIYDGAFSVSLVQDRNHIDRAYALSLLHPAPRKVLMIGLSSGSWAQVLAHHPQLESLEIVEINPGYLDLIRTHPNVSSLLTNPKVTMHIDDGRRWLNRHEDRKFDVIVMNTSFHWRGMVTNLLSAEFMQLARRHLAPGGVFYFNTTASQEAMRTAALAAPNAVRVYNFMALSDTPFDLDTTRWAEKLRQYTIDGRPVIDTTSAGDVEMLRALVQRAAATAPEATDSAARIWIEPRASVLARTANLRVITDDNMITEWTAAAGSPGPMLLAAFQRWRER